MTEKTYETIKTILTEEGKKAEENGEKIYQKNIEEALEELEKVFNKEWILISSGKMPDVLKRVQITYLGYYDKKPHADGFAYVDENGVWRWNDEDDEVKVEITAWRDNILDPFESDVDDI